MTELQQKYSSYNKQFWCWWVTDILTVILCFSSLFASGNSRTVIIVSEIVLTVISIVGLVAAGAKRSNCAKKMVKILFAEHNDNNVVFEKLREYGVRKAEAISLTRARIEKPAQSKQKDYQNPKAVCCPHCGSPNIKKAKSSVDQFFWVIVITSALGVQISPFVMFAFGFCCVCAVISFIIDKVRETSSQNMVCKQCNYKFEI